MTSYLAEFIGTAMLILLGNGVVCNVVLAKTKGNSSGWIVIAAGWGMAVFCAACIASASSGAHLNPALSIALTLAGSFEGSKLPGYIIAQFAGAIAGASLVYLFYRFHFEAEESAESKLACFATSPALPGNWQAFLCETIGTFVLVFTILQFQSPTLEIAGTKKSTVGLGANQLLPVGLLVFAIGVSLGGTTGYAINPARDLGPRIVHHLIPIPGKRDSNWGYAWVPVFGPILGAVIAVLLAKVCAFA